MAFAVTPPMLVKLPPANRMLPTLANARTWVELEAGSMPGAALPSDDQFVPFHRATPLTITLPA